MQCLDRVLILDVTRNGPIKLAEVKSPGSQEPGFHKFKMGIARGQLIIVNPPNIIEEFNLKEIYSRKGEDVPLYKVFPTYNY